MSADALRDGQSQAGATFLLGDRIVSLLELLEQLGLIGGRNAGSLGLLVPLSLLSNQIGGCVRPFGIPTIEAIIRSSICKAV